MNAYVIRNQFLDIRKRFFDWKNFTERFKTVDFNETEDGPTNVQCWNLRVECNAYAD